MNLIVNQYPGLKYSEKYKSILLIVLLFGLSNIYPGSVYSQSSDIHSYNVFEKDISNLDYADSLAKRDLGLALDFYFAQLSLEKAGEKPDYYSSLLRGAIHCSFLMGNLKVSDSLDSVLVNFPKSNLHPIFQARIAYNQARSAQNQNRYIESLDYAKESLLRFQSSSDKNGQLSAINTIIRIYYDLGNYQDALNYLPAIERLLVDEKDTELVFNVLARISKLYVYVDNYSEAQSFLSRAQKIVDDHDLTIHKPALNYYYGVLYYRQKNYPKALDFFDKAAKGKYHSGALISFSSTLTYQAAIAMKQKKYSLAEYYNREALKIREETKNNYLVGSSHYNIANCLIHQYKFDSAYYYIEIADDIFSIYKVKPNVKRGNQLLMNIYLLQKDYKNAYHTLQHIIEIEDSIYRHQNKVKLDELESNIQISQYELKKSELLAKSLNEKNQNETNRLFIKISLIVLIFSTLFSYLLFLRIREKNKRKLLLINQKMIFIQMNSHFVFNALTAIQSLLFKKQIESAIHYLTIFSNLVRKVLFVTGKKYIGLQMEISFTMEFLQLQKLRFGDDLRYQIDISNILLQLNHKVPPLLLYPYIEYAIEECVQKTDKSSMLVVNADSTKKHIIYRLVDIGLGFSELENCYIRRFAKDKISCLELTQQRISMYNQFYRNRLEFYKEEFSINGIPYPSITFKIRK